VVEDCDKYTRREMRGKEEELAASRVVCVDGDQMGEGWCWVEIVEVLDVIAFVRLGLCDSGVADMVELLYDMSKKPAICTRLK